MEGGVSLKGPQSLNGNLKMNGHSIEPESSVVQTANSP